MNLKLKHAQYTALLFLLINTNLNLFAADATASDYRGKIYTALFEAIRTSVPDKVTVAIADLKPKDEGRAKRDTLARKINKRNHDHDGETAIFQLQPLPSEASLAGSPRARKIELNYEKVARLNIFDQLFAAGFKSGSTVTDSGYTAVEHFIKIYSGHPEFAAEMVGKLLDHKAEMPKDLADHPTVTAAKLICTERLATGVASAKTPSHVRATSFRTSPVSVK